jgi:AcrR family transcriptional regulator
MRKTDEQELLERLIKCAQQQIITQGPRNLRMDDLAHDLGVSKKTIYQVVPSKEALIEQIIHRFGANVRHGMKAVIEDPDITFEQKVTAFFEWISQSLQRYDQRVFMELERYYPSIFVKVEQIRREVIPEMISLLITQGQMTGSVREDLDIRFFSEAFLQSIQGLFRTDSLNIHGLQPHEIPRRLGKLFIYGILTNSGSSEVNHHPSPTK